jgi:H+/Cl- antiporter ClcA
VPWRSILTATLLTVVFALPLALTLWALLDAARRPQWAWALADRHQALWIALILMGVFSVVGGVAVCAWYLLRVRPVVAAAESGRIPEQPPRLPPRE